MERKYHDVKQGSDAWFELRMGRITSSKFKDVLTGARKKDVTFGGTAYSYMHALIAEKLTGRNHSFTSSATDWGNTYEPLARAEYEDKMFVNVEEIGFCSLGQHIGSSTDGLVSDNGVIEIKCPFNSSNHIDYRINGVPKIYVAQIQGSLYVTGREYCDFVSFDPRFDDDYCIYIERIYRDEEYILKLKERLNLFINEMDLLMLKL